MRAEVSLISSPTPPTPDREHSTNGFLSRNGGMASARSESIHRLIVLGYITAVAIPPAGSILGIVVAVRAPRPTSRHGAWIIILSILAAGVWVLVLTSGALNTTSNQY